MRLNPFSSRFHCEFPVKLMKTRALARRAFSRSASRHAEWVAVIWVPVNDPNFAGGTWVGPKAIPTWCGVLEAPPGKVQRE